MSDKTGSSPSSRSEGLRELLDRVIRETHRLAPQVPEDWSGWTVAWTALEQALPTPVEVTAMIKLLEEKTYEANFFRMGYPEEWDSLLARLKCSGAR